MSEEIKDLLETLVFMERNNLDHLIRTGQAIKWRKGIEQLQQENKELKQTLKGTTHCFDEEEHKYLKKENNLWKDLSIKQAREIEIKDNILTEFEKWLEEKINRLEKMNIDILNPIYSDIVYSKIELKRCLDKLQELKEGGKK